MIAHQRRLLTDMLAIAKEVGVQAGDGMAHKNLGIVYCSLQGDFDKAIESTCSTWRSQRRWAIERGEGMAYGNIGSAYMGGLFCRIQVTTRSTQRLKKVKNLAGGGYSILEPRQRLLVAGDSSKAIENHTQYLAITKEMGDRVWAGRTGTSGLRNVAGGLIQRDQVPTQNLAMAKEMADRVGGAWRATSSAFATSTWESTSKPAPTKKHNVRGIRARTCAHAGKSALLMGVALSLHARADRQGPAATMSEC